MANNNDGNESRNDVKPPRRRYSAEEKRRLLDETVKPGESVSTVARRYNVAPSLLFGWRKAMEAGVTTGLAAEEPLVPASEVKQLNVAGRFDITSGCQADIVEILGKSRTIIAIRDRNGRNRWG
jgi:transposase-like protein